MFDKILEFENALAEFTGAPYVITTDCCTHAIELCLRYKKVKNTKFTSFTYLSVLMTMHKLKISYDLIPEKWVGEYRFYGTDIWDSARRLEPNMYKPSMMQCLSFGFSKPLDIGRGGAILLDNYQDYTILSMMRYDGRDLSVSPWKDQKEFSLGFHYKLNPEECIKGIEKLKEYKSQKDFISKYVEYPDCREIKIND
jgi:dTDP-4-amino-4,6-dideoxygalactose transaminase